MSHLRSLGVAALLSASLWSAPAQAAVVNQVQADFGVITALPYARHFGTTFTDDGIGGHTTVSSSGATVTTGGIDGSVVTRPLGNESGTARFNFYDDHLFTTGDSAGVLTAAALSIGFEGQGIENLQVRLYELGGDGLTTGTPESEVTHGWLSASAQDGAVLNLTSFRSPVTLKAATTYTLEVRGLVLGPTASYGGNLSISAVPELSSWVMVAIGLSLIGIRSAHRGRALRASHRADDVTPG
jgi:hypothetical protein